MAEETSLLQQTFAETGTQLDRIIDAYERKEPTPYIPTGFPVGIKFTNPNDSTELLIKWISDSELQVISNTMNEDFNSNYYFVGEDHGNLGFSNSKANFMFYLNGDDFSSISVITPSYFTYEWIDPSTLPS